MGNAIIQFVVVLGMIICVLLKAHASYIVSQIDNYPVRLARSGPFQSEDSKNHEPLNKDDVTVVKKNVPLTNSTEDAFSIIIVTFNEPLLYKTYINLFYKL